MTKTKINALQLACLLIIIIYSSHLGVGIYAVIRAAGVDAWISVILGRIIGFFLLLVFIYLANYEPDLPLNEKIMKLFGNFVGKIINYILCIFVFLISFSAMFNMTNFIVSQFLPETPAYLVGFIFSLLIIYINFKGIETILRMSLILLVINILLYISAIFGLIPDIDLSNLKPILEFGWNKPFVGSLYVLGLNMAPLFLLLIIPKNCIVNPKKFSKYMIIAYIVEFILTIGIIISTLGVLGINLASVYQYPEYIILKHVKLFNFIDRIENFVTLQWIFGIFIGLSVMVYYIKNMLKTNNKSKLCTIIITTIILIVPFIIYKNNTIFNNYTYKYANILRFIYIGFMLLTSLMVFIKRKKTE